MTTTVTPRTFVVLFSAAMAMLTAACASDAPTAPVAPVAASEATRLTISWPNCRNPSDEIVWLAVQDGTGPWRQVAASSGMFTFDVDSARAAVAYVSHGTVIPSTYVRLSLIHI